MSSRRFLQENPGWSAVSTEADNAAAQATKAAASGKTHYVTHVRVAFSADVVGGKLVKIIEDTAGAATVKWQTYVHGNQYEMEFGRHPIALTGGKDVRLELAASGTAGIKGLATMVGWTAPP